MVAIRKAVSRARSTDARKAGRSARSGSGSGPCSAGARPDIYEEVTRRIVGQLEAGRLPWVQPWRSVSDGSGPMVAMPRNAVTGRAYSGVNVLILWCAVVEAGWPAQGWLTFRQAQAAGACVRKGEHGTCVVFADRFTPEAEKQRARDTGEEARSVPFLKRFTVFNIAQVDGLPGNICPEPVPLAEREIEPLAEEVIAASGVDFRIGGDKAFYAPHADFVAVPPQPLFHEQINYYRTCLHELTHATGHASRLDRKLTGPFGSKDYAHEELVALSGQSAPSATLQ